MNLEFTRYNMFLKVKEVAKSGLDSMVSGKFFPS
jgi:hypothetical protein